ncbi:hypothetical protein V6N11_049373 [Hibiscus sabdariffa]|uniref:Leucine-rich repeat-containing N-terminal plant-type domain-containing protein n=1 Tax=Hibiscus sabdariffa TaxID=183260 RepID=A0ABR1ZAU6_9ROSI
MGPIWLRVVFLTVLVLDGAEWSDGCWDEERIAIFQLRPFLLFAGFNWTEERVSDCCQWEFVECNTTTRRVTRLSLAEAISSNLFNASLFLPFEELRSLDLRGNGLVGYAKNQGFRKLSKLRHLENLDLTFNYFNDSILSSLSKLSSLKSLSLGGNDLFTGSDHNIELSGLETLDLSLTNMKNNLLLHLGGLSSLTTLLLGGNNLEGTLHLQGNGREQSLINLEEIDLSDNLFNNSVVAELSGFSNLRKLTDFLYEISPEFCGWSSLESLDLSYNERREANCNISVAGSRCLRKLKTLYLDGVSTKQNVSLTSLLEPFSSVKTLFLRENSYLSKAVATQELHVLSDVENLFLDNTAVDISFLQSIGILTSLKTLSLSNCSLTGTLPAHQDENKLVGDSAAFGTWLPKFQLEIFCLSNCTTEEHEKVQLPEFLYFQHDLRYVGLSYSNFGGIRFPHWLLQNNTRLEELYMIDSSIVGPLVLPSHPSSELKVLDMSKNKIQHDIPRNFCSLFPHLVVLVMSKNAFETNIPLCLGGMKRNHFEGPIPMGLCSLVYLGFLDLSTNHFSGIIPSCSSLQKMKHVHLAQNELSGTLSDSLFNSSSLVTLDLSENNLTGRIPDWISRLLDLGVLLMKANQFSGEIPLHLCRLQSLSILDLSQNKLSGHVPSCLSNLTLKPRSEKSSVDAMYYRADSFDYVLEDMGLTIYYLTKDYWGSVLQLLTFYPLTFEEEEIQISTKGATYTYKGNILDLLSAIDLSCNQFTGIIPPALGNLSEIRGLNLSHNNLTGPIPSTFSKLKQIESLDLSYNNLIGRIPSELTELTALEIFTVAYNDLSGPLPDRKAQFGTFDESSYKGNSLLCGPPLSKSCNEGGSLGTPSASSREEEDGAIGMGDFYMSFTVSYAIIFLTTVIVLYINPHWRRACYYLVVDSLGRLPCFRRNL